MSAPLTARGPGTVDEGERPAIEAAASWEAVQAQLPKHELGGVDWSEAVRQGLVRPRGADGSSAPAASAFELDFFIPGPSPKFDAYFPHSEHTVWLSCDNCHSALYRYKDNPMKMADLYAGKSCATCHGEVAFPVTQCQRCHTDM